MEHVETLPTHREPWNKGKLVGQKGPSRSRKSGPFGRGYKWKTARETWRSSILGSTVSSVAATFSRCASVTSAMAVRSRREQLLCSRRQSAPFNLKLHPRLEMQSLRG